MSDASDDANALFSGLVSGVDFSLPSVNLADAAYAVPAVGSTATAVPHLTNADLTSGNVNGSGTFDIMMLGLRAQLEGEFKANRLSGAEYTKAYIALTQSAMAASVQFLLGRDAAYWAAVEAQIGAVNARVALEVTKAQLIGARAQVALTEAEFALAKMKTATEGKAYDTAAYALEHLAPEQLALLKEQKETARAQTMDTRSDGSTAVTGAVGKQKQLYDQQITSYKRDAETKLAKIFSDAWITQKTLDEGLSPPSSFTNSTIDTVLGELRTNLSL